MVSSRLHISVLVTESLSTKENHELGLKTKQKQKGSSFSNYNNQKSSFHLSHVQVCKTTKKREKKQTAMPYSFHSFNNPCLTGAAYSSSEQRSRGNTQVLHQSGFEFIRHTVGRMARKQCGLPRALDHISHTLCAPPTTSSSIKRYHSFDVPGCYYITSHHITSLRSIDTDSRGKQYTLHIKTNTRTPEK